MTKVNKLKVGDRVRRIATSHRLMPKGAEGTVSAVDNMWIGVAEFPNPNDPTPYAAGAYELVERSTSINSILDTAKELIAGSRAKDYGPFGHNAQQQADLWNAYLSQPDGTIREITPMDVPAMMVLVKIMRLSGNNTHQDSWVDVAGFAGLAEQVHDRVIAKKSDRPAGVPTHAIRVRWIGSVRHGELAWAWQRKPQPDGRDVDGHMTWRFDRDGYLSEFWTTFDTEGRVWERA